MTIRSFVRAALIVASAALVVACGGGDDGSNPPPADKVEAAVGSSGGSLAHASGASLSVPAAALGSTTTLAIESVAVGGASALPANTTAVGSAFAVTPHGQSFAQPVTVSIPFDAAQVPAGAQLSLMKTSNGASGPWVAVPGASVSGNRISAEVSGFSLFIAAFLPQITGQPQSVSVAAGQGASFAVTAIGFNPPFSYQWRRSNDGGATFTELAGQTAATLTLGATSATAATQGGDDGAQFEVIVSNAGGSVRSAGAMLTVTAAIVAPSITTQPQNTGVAVGATASFSVIATGTNLVYQWQRSNDAGLTFTDIAGASNASFTLVNAQAGDNNARFRARVSNTAGSLVSNPATLTVTTAPPPASNASRIAAGNLFSLAVNAAGVPYSWGSDDSGLLGNGGANTNRSTAAPLGTLTSVRSIATGSGLHGFAIRTDGTVWAWGYRGQIDCQFGATYEAPAQIGGAANIVAVSPGGDHTLMLRNDGVVLALGCNFNGELGRAGTTAATSAVVVQGLPAIKAVAAGRNLSLALDVNGNVWSWGRGALGDGTPPPPFGQETPRSITPTQVPGLTGIIALSTSGDHALALTSGGAVLAWGSNVNGKLGDGAETDRATPVATLLTSGITAIAAGGEFSIALRNDAVVMSWGINETGQIGSGSSSPGYRPAPAPVVGLTQVTAISAWGNGLGHSLALRSDGTVWAWGWNVAGQLGNGSTTFATTPVQVTGLNLN